MTATTAQIRIDTPIGSSRLLVEHVATTAQIQVDALIGASVVVSRVKVSARIRADQILGSVSLRAGKPRSARLAVQAILGSPRLFVDTGDNPWVRHALPVPLQDSYSYQPSEKLVRTQMLSGYTRQRRMWRDGYRKASVTLALTRAQLVSLEEFLDEIGGDWFKMPLVTGDNPTRVAADHHVRVIGDHSVSDMDWQMVRVVLPLELRSTAAPPDEPPDEPVIYPAWDDGSTEECVEEDDGIGWELVSQQFELTEQSNPDWYPEYYTNFHAIDLTAYDRPIDLVVGMYSEDFHPDFYLMAGDTPDEDMYIFPPHYDRYDMFETHALTATYESLQPGIYTIEATSVDALSVGNYSLVVTVYGTGVARFTRDYSITGRIYGELGSATVLWDVVFRQNENVLPAPESLNIVADGPVVTVSAEEGAPILSETNLYLTPTVSFPGKEQVELESLVLSFPLCNIPQ